MVRTEMTARAGGWRLACMAIMLGIAASSWSGCALDSSATVPSAPTPSEGPDPVLSAFRVESSNCAQTVDGRSSGAAIGPDLVVTVAHGIRQGGLLSVRGPAGDSQGGTLVYFDEELDIALIELDQPTDQWLELSPPAVGPVHFVSYADRDAGPVSEQAEITRLTAVTLDGEGRREAARLSGDIEAGDSGAPVIDDDGAMVGMVFASTRNVAKGWAVSSDEVAKAIVALAEGDHDVPASVC